MLNIDGYNSIKEIHCLKDNKIIFERYMETLSKKQRTNIGCVFKSFLSVLVGIAIYERKIGSIEDCVIEYISQEGIAEINWYKVKIKHVLSKTTGIVWPGPMESIPKNMNEVLQLKFESEPGISFRYKPDPQIMVYLLEELYQMDIIKLFEIKVLAHFKNKSYQWKRDSIEEMQVSIDVLDELGQLMLNKGVINGTRLFSEEYYLQSINKYSEGGFPECSSYGLGWWTDDHAGVSYFYAAGFGGQYLIVIPEKNIIISILSFMDKPHPENKMIIGDIMGKV